MLQLFWEGMAIYTHPPPHTHTYDKSLATCSPSPFIMTSSMGYIDWHPSFSSVWIPAAAWEPGLLFSCIDAVGFRQAFHPCCYFEPFLPPVPVMLQFSGWPGLLAPSPVKSHISLLYFLPSTGLCVLWPGLAFPTPWQLHEGIWHFHFHGWVGELSWAVLGGPFQ